MKRSLFTAVLVLLALMASAQDAKNPQLETLLRENIFRTGVNTCPYEYLPAAETPVPAGYKPFYISHYGRHGSRSDWEGTTYSDALKVYERAHELGMLTEEGEAAYRTVGEIIALHNHMNGRLTERGCREHRQIAGRMFQKYRKVFRQTPRVRAVSSTVPRCIVSMAAFTGELISRDPKMYVSWDTGEAFMKYCSSVDPRDVREEAYKLITEHADAHYPDTVQFYARIFKDPSRCREAGDPHALLDGTFAIAAICGAFDYDDTMLRLFTDDDRYWYAQNVSMNLYLRQCNSKEFGDRRMAVPECEAIMQDIVDKADEVIAGGGWAADLRFGHDYQLLAACSRLGIKGIAERMDAKECLDWPGYLYSPFAGNLQIVFYRGKAGDVLVKFYINERETSLITLPGGPYYKWEDVKEAFKKIPTA
ncbi:MAG: hypothetical protein IK031_04655 [Bacteroidales bacterium]|nr:hypothetical protein [Bacteroidales bacterium]